ncbi:lipase [Marasmius fiardii PR-910]|nr:lipase [Marasmius fiardii PR-910]
MLRSLATLLIALTVVVASPTPEKRQSVTILSTAQVATFKPYSFYAATAYCQPANTLAWNCGANCQANPTFKPVASGGNGGSVQFWYVGYDPTLKTVIVGHQGTNFSEIDAVLTDADFFLDNLDSSLFPGVPSSVKAHNGFADEQAGTARQVLAAVQQALSANSANKVTVVGHSLGAALALLDALYLRLQLPSTTTVNMINYASPRVGNSEFADFVDSHLPGIVHVTNKKDIVPILPGRFLGYAHPNGEVHIKEDNTWASCPGHDNTDTQCTVGDVPNIFEGNIDDHSGPYDGVDMSC